MGVLQSPRPKTSTHHKNCSLGQVLNYASQRGRGGLETPAVTRNTGNCQKTPNPSQKCVIICVFTNTARVVKLVDSGDSKSPAARRAGSSPAPGTISGNPAIMRVSSESRPILTGWPFFVFRGVAAGTQFHYHPFHGQAQCLRPVVAACAHSAVLGHIVCIGRCGRDRVHQARHRVSLLSFLVELGAAIRVASTTALASNSSPQSIILALTVARICWPHPCTSSM